MHAYNIIHNNERTRSIGCISIQIYGRIYLNTSSQTDLRKIPDQQKNFF